jgi:alkanesulfonate monooxygenase SsuD/methylene tetrahydromethanopterin reductase-like flavin-dependent oxidoreductase (luciferase family)
MLAAMPMFGLRYDLRCPPFARATPQQLTEAALEQCAWADERGFATVTLSEHHGSPDGYLPSPLVLAAAIAARTQRMRIVLAALIAPLHDPIRLAEDLAVLDVVSGGRVIPVLAGGYVESEFRTFGRRLAERPRAMEEIIGILERSWTGEPFEHRGVTVRVTPRPVQRPRPPLFMGGASPAAARRAARLADHFIPSVPGLFEVFREERRKLGRPDIAPHALHETNAYAEWLGESGGFSPYETALDADALRQSGHYPVLTPDELIAMARELPAAGTVMLHPLMGGMDPELGWESLRLVESQVLPALT